MAHYILIELYTGKSLRISQKEFKEWTSTMELKKGSDNVWIGEEHIIIEVKPQ